MTENSYVQTRLFPHFPTHKWLLDPSTLCIPSEGVLPAGRVSRGYEADILQLSLSLGDTHEKWTLGSTANRGRRKLAGFPEKESLSPGKYPFRSATPPSAFTQDVAGAMRPSAVFVFGMVWVGSCLPLRFETSNVIARSGGFCRDLSVEATP